MMLPLTAQLLFGFGEHRRRRILVVPDSCLSAIAVSEGWRFGLGDPPSAANVELPFSPYSTYRPLIEATNAALGARPARCGPSLRPSVCQSLPGL
jgi:hypothetical protein